MTYKVLYFGLLLGCSGCTWRSVNPTIPSDLGVYLGWVGSFDGNRLEEGVRLARQMGFQTVRLPLTASVATDFRVGASCDPRHSLAELASLPVYATILREPAFKMIVLTTWGDSHTYNPCGPLDPHSDQHSDKRYLDETFYAGRDSRNSLREEYAQLAYELSRKLSGSGKVIGISNWEGDNELYCDSAWYFAMNPGFRASCEHKRSTSGVVNAYRQFLTLRQEGLVEGRERARREGFNDVSVLSVVEFSALRFLNEKNLPSVLDDVLPTIPMPDFVSYSAWESLGLPIPEFAQDLAALQKRFGRHLIVGEFGFDRGLDSLAAKRAADVIKVMRTSGIRCAIWWQIFDQPPLFGLGDKGLYGLYDRKGEITQFGVIFSREHSDREMTKQ